MLTRIAAYAIITRGSGSEREMLLSHWRGDGVTGAWTLPGGGIDPGEDPKDATIREVFEETGYHVELTGLHLVDSIVVEASDRVYDTSQPMHGIRIVYSADVTGGELQIEVDGSSDDAGWHRVSDVPSLAHVQLVSEALRVMDHAPAAL